MRGEKVLSGRTSRKSRRGLLLTLLLIPALTAEIFAQGGRNAINGVVIDSGRMPINRIRVELQNELEQFVTQTYTDAAGRYYFRNLSQGVFIVKVHSDGKHAEQSTRVILQALRNTGASHYEQIDFMLRDLAEKKPTGIPGNSGATFAQDVPENARKAYERGVRQLDNPGESSQGIESLREALKVFPKYYSALERLGIEYVRLQQYEAAREVLARGVEINRNGAAGYYGLGVAQFHLQQVTESVESLRRAILLAPDSSNIAFEHFYLGLGLWKLDRHGDSEPHLKKAAELGGTNIPADVHMYLAQYYSESQRYLDAANELETFLRLVPNAQDTEKISKLIRQLRAKVRQ
jgi:tetratricopeptide (TPR) repeat protein